MPHVAWSRQGNPRAVLPLFLVTAPIAEVCSRDPRPGWKGSFLIHGTVTHKLVSLVSTWDCVGTGNASTNMRVSSGKRPQYLLKEKILANLPLVLREGGAHTSGSCPSYTHGSSTTWPVPRKSSSLEGCVPHLLSSCCMKVSAPWYMPASWPCTWPSPALGAPGRGLARLLR